MAAATGSHPGLPSVDILQLVVDDARTILAGVGCRCLGPHGKRPCRRRRRKAGWRAGRGKPTDASCHGAASLAACCRALAAAESAAWGLGDRHRGRAEVQRSLRGASGAPPASNLCAKCAAVGLQARNILRGWDACMWLFTQRRQQASAAATLTVDQGRPGVVRPAWCKLQHDCGRRTDCMGPQAHARCLGGAPRESTDRCGAAAGSRRQAAAPNIMRSPHASCALFRAL